MRKVINMRFKNTFTSRFQFARNFNEIPPKASNFFLFDFSEIIATCGMFELSARWKGRGTVKITASLLIINLMLNWFWYCWIHLCAPVDFLIDRATTEKEIFLFLNRIFADISTTSRKMGHAMNHCMCAVHLLDTLFAAHAFNVHMATFGILISIWGWAAHLRLNGRCNGLLNGVQEISYSTTFKHPLEICISRGS